ncbi:glycosyltransferase family 25 [Diplonema papillatum]|nr:glycosyltransferase family 25 [Diplonema papillatum]
MWLLVQVMVVAAIPFADVLLTERADPPPDVLWINLARRSDRAHKMLTTILPAFTNSHIQRVLGVDGNQLSQQQCKAAVHDSDKLGDTPTITHNEMGKLLVFHDSMTKGVVGCALSHRKTWRIVVASGISNPVIILEDDLTWVHPHVVERFQTVLSSLPPTWDLVYLAYHGGYHTNQSLPNISVYPTNQTWFAGLFMYALHGQTAARRLLQLWPLTHQLDKHLAFACQLALNCFRLPQDQVLATAQLSEESLDSDVQKFHLHRVP